MTMITAHTRISRGPDILPAEIDGELLLMDIDGGDYIGLKGTARQIWDLVEVPREFAQLCALLQDRYRAPPGRIDADVKAFVGRLAARNLVVLT